MEILYMLIPLSIALVFVIGAMFWWGIDRGQFDDLETQGADILDDDDRVSAALADRASASPIKRID